MIDTIIFDAEGIIINSEALWDKSQEIFLERYGISYDRDLMKPKLAGRSIREGVEIMKQIYNIEDDTKKMLRERTDIIRRLFSTGIDFIEGFLGFFDEVKQRGLKYCVATSMEESLMLSIDKKLELLKRFDQKIFYISDVGGKSKPNPGIFLYACEQIISTPANCLVIEDSINGVMGARNAQMKCVALTSTFSREQLKMADRVVDHLSEIDVKNLDSWL